jgi:hypothetical protein
MNKPYNIQNTNICNGIFHISFFKALLINEGETTHWANRIRGEMTQFQCHGYNFRLLGCSFIFYGFPVFHQTSWLSYAVYHSSRKSTGTCFYHWHTFVPFLWVRMLSHWLLKTPHHSLVLVSSSHDGLDKWIDISQLIKVCALTHIKT